MVGPGARMTFSEMVSRKLDKPYSKGSVGEASFDCLGLVLSSCWERGMYCPDHFKDWNLSNYAEYYTKDLKAAIGTCIEFFDSFMERVSGKVAGDVMLVTQPNGTRYVAIYAGNGQAISCFIKTGVQTFQLDEGNTTEIVWRPKCQQQ